MANPTTAGAIVSPVDFATRLQLVGEAVEARITRTPTTNPFEIRARLWVQWINKNLLSVPASQGEAA
jgi:hypothetical protein